jgi:hypothetical protein
VYIFVYNIFCVTGHVVGPGVKKIDNGKIAEANIWISKGFARLATADEIAAYERAKPRSYTRRGDTGAAGLKGR